MIIGKCLTTSEADGARIATNFFDQDEGFEPNRNYFLKTVVKGLGLRQTEFTDGIVDSSFCVNCGNLLRIETFKLGDYGEFTALRSECKSCREKEIIKYETEQKAQEYVLKQARCGGKQNRKIKHCGIEVGWTDIKDGFDFQKPFLDYVEKILDDKEEAGAYMYGGSGTGKTFLAKLLNNELVDKTVNVAFFKAVDLAMMLRSASMQKGDYMGKLLMDLRTVEVLIIDDLGTQKNTDFVKEMMFSVFDTRYDNRKKTVITTNLTADDIGDDRLDSRFSDTGWMTRFNFKQKDIRRLTF